MGIDKYNLEAYSKAFEFVIHNMLRKTVVEKKNSCRFFVTVAETFIE
jgi:hypothetical protein